MTQTGRGAAHNLLFDIILSPKYFVSDGASIMEVTHFFVFSLLDDGSI
jgi:hypothetical protein